MRKGLGRGLDAILPPRSEPAPEAKAGVIGAGVQTLPLTSLVPNQLQPRATFDEEGLEDLARSIRAQGVIQPLVVAPRPDGRFTIVAGERRWRAAQRCGMTEIPVVVRDVDSDRQLLELALVENLQRADLNSIEEAEAYRSLQERFQLTQDEIADRVGRARATVTNSLRLLRLPLEVQDLLRGGTLTAGQARPLLGIDSPRRQIELARQAARDGMSARRLEAMASAPARAARSRARGAAADVHSAAAADALTRALQTRVEIRRSGKGGTVRIHFHSEEELIRIHELLLGRVS
jgi:ParB family chromosome partitioning protein